ncbi:7-cyano-7-deazaguanine synthase QueC [Microtetraspora fusca]|uniref:7-cyano-7-deazaguanine synthase n=1 Tax=Microtetraspora fusca TaxID=1997 RepID=A0ABW6VE05_MICFU
MTTTLILLSGGLDSTVLAAHYYENGDDLHALSVDYGQRHIRELDSARAVADHYGIRHDTLDLRAFGQLLSGSALTDTAVSVPDGHYAEASMKVTVVPNRNMVLLSAAAAVAVARGCDRIATAVHAGDHFIYPDCRPAFIEAFRDTVALGNEGFARPGFTVETPFIGWTKTAIVHLGHNLDAPLYLSWSCYKGGDLHCGTCGTCQERRQAFAEACVGDPTGYADAATTYQAPAVP